MDPSISDLVTDKVIEKLVETERYTVLERSVVEGILREREFQVSGAMSANDAMMVGKYLGADLIVMSKIAKVGDTWFISGIMINIATGVIMKSTSAQGAGEQAIPGVAGKVGATLAGGP